MKYYSTRTKITIAFSLAFFFICMFFIATVYLEIQKNNKKLNEQQQHFVDNILNNYNASYDKDIIVYLQSTGFKLLHDDELAQRVKKHGTVSFSTVKFYGEFKLISYKNQLFLWLKNSQYDLVLYINRAYISFEFLLFGFLLAIFFFLLLYFAIMEYLNPLKILSNQIDQIMKGKKFTSYKYKQDEIGKIAFEFFNILDKNQNLLYSRQFFLRAIMHELKTPIGKGMIIAQLLNDEKQKNRLLKVFKRLDSLINESAKMENLFSKSYVLEPKEYKFKELVMAAKDLLMIDDFDNKVIIARGEDIKLTADIETCALVLKNLIDNAIKYSLDGICIIECFDEYVIVKNKAKAPLKYKFEEYTKAFVREKGNKQKGMGLGLYIVDQICSMCNLSLNYSFENYYHIFKISKVKYGE